MTCGKILELKLLISGRYSFGNWTNMGLISHAGQFSTYPQTLRLLLLN
jgi:hypothetical protein